MKKFLYDCSRCGQELDWTLLSTKEEFKILEREHLCKACQGTSKPKFILKRRKK
jgi:DNA-directed RNA polymerase subunit RPC12/RpoP